VDAKEISELRRELRRRRRALDDRHREAGVRTMLKSLVTDPLYWRSRHIALFMSNDGEPNLDILFCRLLRDGKRCYLPVIREDRRLYFLRYRGDDALPVNRFGIPEPAFRPRELRRADLLDLVLTPLVGFDARGNRLGMGAGYYDRSFAFRRDRRSRRPFLLGVAWACQETAELPVRDWDVALDAVINEHGLQRFPRASTQPGQGSSSQQ
jgi:5-formyltetrahydrofolate cyclo-ligase